LREILRELKCETLAVEVVPDHDHVFALCPPILQRLPELKAKAACRRL